MKTLSRGLVLGAAALVLAPTPATAQFSMPTTPAHAPFFYPTAYRDEGSRDWNCGSIYYSGHGGTDIGVGGFSGMDAGRDLVAAADGTVIVALDGFFDRCTTANCPGGGGFGNYVAIDHGGGIVTYYGHMRQWSVLVQNGQQVTCGTPIGQVGSSGRSTGPHIHFDYRVGGVRSEPFAGPCGAGSSAWNQQGSHGGLPGITCTGGPSGPAPIIVDDQDPGFSFTIGTVADANAAGSGGHDGAFYWQAPFAAPNGSDPGTPPLQGRWVPDIVQTGLYDVHVYAPGGGVIGATAAPYDIGFQGGHAPVTVDLTPGGDWVPLFPGQPLKFVAGQNNYVTAHNVTFAAEAQTLAFDAVRWTWAGPAGGSSGGQGCSYSGNCSGNLICVGGACTAPCTAGSCAAGLSCEVATGVCGYGEYGEDDFEPGPLWNPPLSQDTDGDGIPDWIEENTDSDGDGFPDWLDLDSDDDGVPDEVEGNGDYDQDGVPNYLDEDSDNDGVSDGDEAGEDPENPVDSDGDGAPDTLDGDSDEDGLPDAVEYGDDPAADFDGDGIPDALDPDSDNDGILDGVEWGPDPENAVDSDGDGVPDWQDGDSDGDGLTDSFEGDDDSDGDGIPDYLDLDSDEDGIPDDEDPDSDGDGIDDAVGQLPPPAPPAPTQDCGCDRGVPTSLSWLPLLALPFGVGARRRR